jgi:hypothetical protein
VDALLCRVPELLSQVTQWDRHEPGTAAVKPVTIERPKAKPLHLAYTLLNRLLFVIIGEVDATSFTLRNELYALC